MNDVNDIIRQNEQTNNTRINNEHINGSMHTNTQGKSRLIPPGLIPPFKDKLTKIKEVAEKYTPPQKELEKTEAFSTKEFLNTTVKEAIFKITKNEVLDCCFVEDNGETSFLYKTKEDGKTSFKTLDKQVVFNNIINDKSVASINVGKNYLLLNFFTMFTDKDKSKYDSQGEYSKFIDNNINESYDSDTKKELFLSLLKTKFNSTQIEKYSSTIFNSISTEDLLPEKEADEKKNPLLKFMSQNKKEKTKEEKRIDLNVINALRKEGLNIELKDNRLAALNKSLYFSKPLAPISEISIKNLDKYIHEVDKFDLKIENNKIVVGDSTINIADRNDVLDKFKEDIYKINKLLDNNSTETNFDKKNETNNEIVYQFQKLKNNLEKELNSKDKNYVKDMTKIDSNGKTQFDLSLYETTEKDKATIETKYNKEISAIKVAQEEVNKLVENLEISINKELKEKNNVKDMTKIDSNGKTQFDLSLYETTEKDKATIETKYNKEISEIKEKIITLNKKRKPNTIKVAQEEVDKLVENLKDVINKDLNGKDYVKDMAKIDLNGKTYDKEISTIKVAQEKINKLVENLKETINKDLNGKEKSFTTVKEEHGEMKMEISSRVDEKTRTEYIENFESLKDNLFKDLLEKRDFIKDKDELTKVNNDINSLKNEIEKTIDKEINKICKEEKETKTFLLDEKLKDLVGEDTFKIAEKKLNETNNKEDVKALLNNQIEKIKEENKEKAKIIDLKSENIGDFISKNLSVNKVQSAVLGIQNCCDAIKLMGEERLKKVEGKGVNVYKENLAVFEKSAIQIETSVKELSMPVTKGIDTIVDRYKNSNLDDRKLIIQGLKDYYNELSDEKNAAKTKDIKKNVEHTIDNLKETLIQISSNKETKQIVKHTLSNVLDIQEGFKNISPIEKNLFEELKTYIVKKEPNILAENSKLISEVKSEVIKELTGLYTKKNDFKKQEKWENGILPGIVKGVGDIVAKSTHNTINVAGLGVKIVLRASAMILFVAIVGITVNAGFEQNAKIQNKALSENTSVILKDDSPKLVKIKQEKQIKEQINMGKTETQVRDYCSMENIPDTIRDNIISQNKDQLGENEEYKSHNDGSFSESIRSQIEK